jgi:hypothetical protein
MAHNVQGIKRVYLVYKVYRPNSQANHGFE